MNDRKKTAWICLGLVLAIVAVFGSAIGYDFVFFDDQGYVLDNHEVTTGLTWHGVIWAFTSGYEANWHPLTWLSHMFDCQLFGLNPAGPHLVNIILHAGSSVLLFLLVKRLTGKVWPSAAMAAFFALHPLRLESVAWIAERKDVLSMFFGLWTLWAYVLYVKTPTAAKWWRNPRYGLVILVFIIGLLAKSSIVTVPILLLLLDFWPLNRWSGQLKKNATASQFWRRGWTLFIEKIPLLLCSFSVAVMTVVVQRKGGAVTVAAARDLPEQIAHVLIAYEVYFRKNFWPGDCSVLYLWHPSKLWEAVPGLLFLISISVVAVMWAKRRPWVLVGWAWFLIALLPMVGIVQIGTHFVADRYMYLPGIGVAMMVVFGVADLRLEWLGQRRNLFLGLVTLSAIGLLGRETARQREYWRNAETLFGQALKIEPHNFFIRDALAGFYHGQGRLKEALAQLELSAAEGPNCAGTWNQWGTMLSEVGRYPEAESCFRKALVLKPDEPECLVNLATTLKKLGRWDKALVNLKQALSIKPKYAPAHSTLATILDGQNNPAEAMREYLLALEYDPYDAVTHNNVGVTLLAAGNAAGALPHVQAAADLQPKNFQFHFSLSCALAGLGRAGDAAVEYRRTLALNPDFVPALQGLAWWLATNPASDLRSGEEALQLAERGCALTGEKDHRCLAARDAALAAVGRFTEAIMAVEKTATVASAAKDTAAVKFAGERLAAYREGHAYRAP